MSLQSELDTYKASFRKRAPAHAQEIMSKATDELHASGIVGQAIQLGDTLPHFNLPNQDGELVSSQALLEDGPLVVSFFRGIWCPYCNIELEALNRALPEIKAHRANFVTISPQLGKSAKRNKKSKNLDFDILIDEGNEYAKDLGLVFALPNDLREVYRSFDIDLPKHNGDESWTLPMPARLVINEDNKVVYANVNPDYTVRPEPEEFLKVIQDIRDPLTV
jgi:peroxiredoxin